MTTMIFEQGKTYDAKLNGRMMSFLVLKVEQNECFIQWSDGEEEWAYVNDMIRWVNDAQ